MNLTWIDGACFLFRSPFFWKVYRSITFWSWTQNFLTDFRLNFSFIHTSVMVYFVHTISIPALKVIYASILWWTNHFWPCTVFHYKQINTPDYFYSSVHFLNQKSFTMFFMTMFTSTKTRVHTIQQTCGTKTVSVSLCAPWYKICQRLAKYTANVVSLLIITTHPGT